MTTADTELLRMIRIFQKFNEEQRKQVLQFAETFSGDTSSHEPGPGPDAAGAEPQGGDPSEDTANTSQNAGGYIDKNDTKAATKEPEAAKESGQAPAGAGARTSVTEDGDGKYVDNYNDLQIFKERFAKKGWKKIIDTSTYTCEISKAEKDAWKKYANEAEDAAIVAELELMADNQILLMQNERCPFLKMSMQSDKIETMYFESEDKNGNSVFTKKLPEFQGHHEFAHSGKIKLYGLEEEWQHERQNHGTVQFFYNALADLMTRNCSTSSFGMKPRVKESDWEKEKRGVFVNYWDNEEIVIGDEAVWEKMSDDEKQIAKLRGKVLGRNGALNLGPDAIKFYMDKLLSPDQRQKLQEFYYERYKEKDLSKVFTDYKGEVLVEGRGKNKHPIEIKHSADYWNKVIKEGLSKYVRKTIFGHVWKIVVRNCDVDVLMSEALDFIGMDEFAARLLSRLNEDNSLKDTYGFVVEKRGLELRASGFDYQRCQKLKGHISTGKDHKKHGIQSWDADNLEMHESQLEKLYTTGEISPKCVDQEVLKRMIINIQQDQDGMFVYQYWKKFMFYYHHQLNQNVTGHAKQWNQGMEERVTSLNGRTRWWGGPSGAPNTIKGIGEGKKTAQQRDDEVMKEKSRNFIDQSAVKPEAPQSTEICFVSDIEGDLDYFEEFVKKSSIIKFVQNKFELDFQNLDTKFVFGGDSQDTGIGDIRFVHLLLNFKKKYPERVFLIIGNRDVNKLRMKAELAEVEKMVKCMEQGKRMQSEILKDQFPYWKEPNASGNKQLKTFEQWCTEKKGLGLFDCDSTNITVQKRNYMRWAFAETWGMHNTFETRKLELQLIGAMKKIIQTQFPTSLGMKKEALDDLGKLSCDTTDSAAVVKQLPKLYITENYTISPSNLSYVTNWREDGADLVIDVYNSKSKPIRITRAGNSKIFETLKTVLPRDEEVIESFEKECDPNCKENYEWFHKRQKNTCPKNFMLEYLENADIMTIHEKTVFCHGGISKKNLYKMPDGLCEQDDTEVETIGYGNLKYKKESFKTIAEWCQHLNEWKKKKIIEYRQQNGLIRHGGELAAYGLEPLKNHTNLNEQSQSVTYTNMLTEDLNGKEIEEEVLEALGKDLDIIATGHQPVSDCPLIIRTANKLSVTVDTCKSKHGHKMWWGFSNRTPDNVHEVVINGSRISMKGRLSSRQTDNFACDTDDDLIGKMVQPGDDGKQFWVRFKFSKRRGNQYHCVYTKGFANEVMVKKEKDLRQLLNMPLPSYQGRQDMLNFECDCCGQTFVESCEHAQSGDATCQEYDATCQEYDATCHEYDTACHEYDTACQKYDATCQEYDATCQEYDATCHEYDATCQEYDATCQEYDATCQEYDATCQEYDATCQGYNDCNHSTQPTGYTPTYSTATEMPYQQNYCMYPVHMMHGPAMYYFSY